MKDLIWYMNYAEDNGFRLNMFAPRIIQNSLRGRECPCPGHEDQIRELGQCECKLFQREDFSE